MNDRISMPSAMPSELAERLSDVDTITAAEQALIDRLADQMVVERLYQSREHFADLMDGIEGRHYYDQLQRIVRETDAACKGDLIALQAMTEAAAQIQAMLKREAAKAWRDELGEEAEVTVLGVEA